MSEGSFSKATNANPKDLFGAKKVSITKLPAIGLLHGAHAMMDGATKYGPYNWRAKKVIASIYVDAAKRHLEAWFEGEETAEDSGVHHLGHALACCALLLDAQETGNLVDDRPEQGSETPLKSVYASTLKRLNAAIAKATERKVSTPEAPRGDYLSHDGQPIEASDVQNGQQDRHPDLLPSELPDYPGIVARGQPPHYT